MARLGTFVVLPDELYEATFHPNSISGGSRETQARVAEIIVAIRDGGDEPAPLAEAARLRVTRRGEAPGLYFIARSRRAQRGRGAAGHLLRTIRRNPLHWRAWAALITGR